MTEADEIRAAMALPGWKWQEGTRWVVRRDEPFEDIAGRCLDGLDPYPGAIPDPYDDATGGVLLALLGGFPHVIRWKPTTDADEPTWTVTLGNEVGSGPSLGMAAIRCALALALARMPTHALTLWPEWAYAIAHLGKDVENRSWRPPAWLIGRRLAIHAGADLGGRPGRMARLEAQANLLCALGREPPVGVQIATRRIVAVVTVGEPTRDSQSPWAVPGEWHWPLTEVVRVDVPVLRGAQGLWRLTDDQRVIVASYHHG